MEGLQRRFGATKKTNPEDQSEFLDEEEQEKLLQDLRAQNERSNLAIQRGLVLIDFLVSAIYAIYLHDKLYPSNVFGITRIPVPFSSPISSIIDWPEIAALCSIGAVYATIYLFVRACRLSPMQVIWNAPATARGLGQPGPVVSGLAAVLSLVAPCLALWSQTSWIEVGFWSLPLIALGMDLLALRMMSQVEGKIADLDKARYKYKGA